MAFPNWIGSHKRLWTREHVVERLAQAAKELPGPLPCCDADYNRLKKGRLDWPTSSRVLEYFGSMAHAWLAAGVEKERIRLDNLDWTGEENDYLLDHAGIDTLEQIALHLRRSRGAVHRHLYELGVHARDSQGMLSAAQLAKEYKCPYHRIRAALAAGQIPGRYDPVRNRWNVAIDELTPESLAILQQPKLHSYKTRQTDLGDYYKRYGIRRTQCQTGLSLPSSEVALATRSPIRTSGDSKAPCSTW